MDYKGFSRLTAWGTARRGRIEEFFWRQFGPLLPRGARLLEIGPGRGDFARLCRREGIHYQACEPDKGLREALLQQGFEVHAATVPPIPLSGGSVDAIYANQVLEHLPGAEEALELMREAYRVIVPGGILALVVPNYLREGPFFFEVDYTHRLPTTPRGMRQLLFEGGFRCLRVVRSVGALTGLAEDIAKILSRPLGWEITTTAFRWAGLEEVLFKVRKNLFETLCVVGQKESEPHRVPE